MRYSLRLTPKNTCFLLTVITAVTLLPFLGEALFYSKGEPREAIVAVSMLNSGDWILPESNGEDIPYKPPFMAWCIALISLLTGHVTEYTSRLPSALALIGMIVWFYEFFRRRTNWAHAFIGGLVTLTAFEVYRAGFACRVDMLLTFFIVGAIFALYTYWERGMKGFPWLAVLMMGGGTLTKGPVAIVLPCAVIFVFMLLRGEKPLRVIARLILPAIISVIIPSVWYYAAYLKEGKEFMSLMMEENVGRMTGTMSYDSHEKPLWYNFVTVIMGYLPYTLLLILSLIPFRHINAVKTLPLKNWWSRFRQLDAPHMLALVAIVVIFVFYCIPHSKRSVYLLPIYPFIALFIADYVAWLVRIAHKSIKIYATVLSAVITLVFAAFVVIQCGWFPYSIFKGKHALDNALMVTSLEQHLSLIKWLLVELSAAVALFTLWKIRRAGTRPSFIMAIAVTVTFYWAFAGVYQPRVLEAKSDKKIAAILDRHCPEGNIYSYVKMPMLRYYGANYYVGDRIKPFRLAKGVKSGYLIVGVEDAREFLPQNADDYDFYLIEHIKSRSADVRQQVLLLRFVDRQP